MIASSYPLTAPLSDLPPEFHFLGLFTTCSCCSHDTRTVPLLRMSTTWQVRSDRSRRAARRRDIDSRYYYRTSGEIAVLAYVSFILCPKPSACASETVRVCVRNRPGCARSGILAPLCLFNPFFQEPVGSEVTRCLRGALVRLVGKYAPFLDLGCPVPPARGPLYPTSYRDPRLHVRCVPRTPV